MHSPQGFLARFIFPILILLLAGCGSGGGTPSNEKVLETFSFLMSQNPQFSKNVQGHIDQDGGIVRVVLPIGTDPRGLVASFTFKGKQVKVGDVVQQSGITVNNFSYYAGKSYTVVADDDSQKNYQVIVREGDDTENEMTSFRFEKDNNPSLPYDLMGAISHKNSQIEVRVPKGTDTTGLVASFESTGVAVYVDGSEQFTGNNTQDYSQGISFEVHAGNSAIQNYQVVITEETCDTNILEGSYTVESEADLDALVGVTAVNGWLTIGKRRGFTPVDISSLDKLACLSHVTGDLVIAQVTLTDLNGLQNLFSTTRLVADKSELTSFQGLAGLKVVEGISLFSNDNLTNLNGLSSLLGTEDIYIEGSSISNFIGLSSLESIEDIIISYNGSVRNFDGLQGLNKIRGKVSITINSSLESLHGLNNLKKLGSLDLDRTTAFSDMGALSSLEYLGALSVEDVDLLTSLAGLENVKLMDKGLALQNNALLENVNALTNMSGNLIGIRLVANPALSSIQGLIGVTGLSSSLYLEGLPGLTTLEGLNNITTTTDLRVYGLENLIHLNDVNSLAYAGSVALINNPKLESIAGLSSLTRMDDNGQLWIKDNPALVSLQGVQNANGVREITIENNQLLVDLQGLNSFDDFFSLKVLNNPSLESVDGLDSLTEASGVTLDSNPQLNDVAGLNGLQQLSVLRVVNNPQLMNLQGLETLQAGGGIYIYDNENLESLSGLDNLTQGIFYIERNNNLRSLAALGNVETVTGGLTVRDNPLLDTFGMDSACWIQGTMFIQNNASLCTSDVDELIAQVEACRGFGNGYEVDNNAICQ